MDDGSGEMDEGGEALIGFVGAHGDAFELFEFAEEILDQVPPFVHLGVDGQRLFSAWVLGDDDLGPALVEVGDNGVAVKGLVGDQSVEADAVDERFEANRVEPLTGQQAKAHKVAERVAGGEDLGRHAALRAAYGLALSPPFAPWPWRWTLTMVASTMAYSMSGAPNRLRKAERRHRLSPSRDIA